MNLFNRVLLHITLPLCGLICVQYFFHFPSQIFPFSALTHFLHPENSPGNGVRASSVFCRGSNHTDRLCSFSHLCYEPGRAAFVFFSGEESVRSGLPLDRFSPALADMSSVEDHNTLYFNYVELPLSASDKFNYSFVEGNALLFKRFHPENLMHVFHDDLIPLYATVLELGLPSPFLLVGDAWPPGPHAHLYEGFLPRSPFYHQDASREHLHCFENIHVGLNKLPTWYQYGFKVPQGPLPKRKRDVAPLLRSFRAHFLQRFVPGAAVRGQEAHAVLFTRKHNRRIVNEKEVVDTIQRVSSLPTRVLSLDDSDVLQVVRSLVRCRLAVGMHGSLLVLSLFLEPSSVLVEAFPFGVQASDITPYRTLCWITGVTYVAWENTLEANTRPHPEYPAHLGGLGELAPEERDRVERSVVTPFLCCEDPVWLYRIYQDTLVDLVSFTATLQSAIRQGFGDNSGTGGHRDSVEIHGAHDYISADDRMTDSKKSNLNSAESISKDAMPNTHNKSPNIQIAHKITQGEKDTESIDSETIDPSEAENVSCAISGTSLTLEWDEPWNLGFTRVQWIEYEVWLQEMDTEDLKAFIVKQKRLVVAVKPGSYYAWVRCYADGRVGPFNSSPTVCSDS